MSQINKKRLNPGDWVKVRETLSGFIPPIIPLETLSIEDIKNSVANCRRVDRGTKAYIALDNLELVETAENYAEYVAAKMAGELG